MLVWAVDKYGAPVRAQGERIACSAVEGPGP